MAIGFDGQVEQVIAALILFWRGYLSAAWAID